MADFGPMVRDAQSSRTGHRAPGTGHRAPGTGHRAPGTGHRAPGTGHLDALLRSIENNLTARDD
ncbi:MAG: hypothetical protein IPG03_15500 [Candidatus Microthrix sp.]|nr:hypothetical protein [Candidatus Microthrix sp.]MBK6503697.1 hypothetical protein [Candidatus Microthrix sp.]